MYNTLKIIDKVVPILPNQNYYWIQNIENILSKIFKQGGQDKKNDDNCGEMKTVDDITIHVYMFELQMSSFAQMLPTIGLTWLLIDGCFLTAKSLDTLAVALPKCNGMKRLSLSNNGLDELGIEFCNSLKKMQKLEYLNLSGNCFLMISVERLANGLVSSPIKHLMLERCGLDSIHPIAECITSELKLTSLIVSNNSISSLQAFTKGGFGNIMEFVINNNKFEEGTTELMRKLVVNSKLKFVTAMSDNGCVFNWCEFQNIKIQ